MRRIVMWFMSTLTVVVLLFGYHTSTSGPTSANSSVVSTGSNGYSGSLGSTSTGSTSNSSGTSGSSDSSGSSGTSGSGGTSGTSSSKTTSVTGDTAQTRWGPVQVAITVSGGRITAVNVPVYPTDNPRDEEINSYALPQLIQETLDQQGANIDMVSGATVTSDGYLQSLQSALDQAGL